MQNEEGTKPVVDLPLHARRFSFPCRHRLSGKLLFTAVYEAKVKNGKGPLAAYSLPNALGHPRLGISISRHVGIAPRRNRIKRLLREAFRLFPYEYPVGYDLVIVVRPHAPLLLGEYQQLMAQMIQKSHTAWQQRS